MSDIIIDAVQRALEHSPFLESIKLSQHNGGLGFSVGDAPLRPLTDREVAALERRGNIADDWSLVRVADGFDCRRVLNSSFHGEVALGRLAGRVSMGGVDLPSGVYRSTLVDCVIGHGALVSDVRLLARTLVGPGAAIFDCGRVVCTGITAYGNGQALPLGLEGEGRTVPIYAEITVEVAAAIARDRGNRKLQSKYSDLVRAYAAAASGTRNLIGADAVVCHTPRVENVVVGPSGRIDGAAQVVDSTILSADDEQTIVESGASVRDSILQWGSRVSTMAVVERAVLCEFSGAERQGQIADALIGSNTTIAQGEVTASLLGPFIGLHHQSLLIAAYWPEGKGNLAAGACVGSNHTTRAPDQEFRPGEGAFLGLGINVKYPVDMSRSPYSVVACGVTLPPQAIAFPFALITASPGGGRDAPAGLNQIIPGWILTDSMYTLARNEFKFQTRNRAKRSALQTDIVRPPIVDLMCEACDRLEGVRHPKEVYTGDDIPGLGKCFLLHQHLSRAIEAYRTAIRFYALRSLVDRTRGLLNAGRTNAARRVLDLPTGSRWEHARRLLRTRCGIGSPQEGLAEIGELARQVAQSVERSKAKDDERGKRIIDDYATAHLPASADPVVKRAWADAERLTREANELIAQLARRSNTRRLTRLTASQAGMS